MPCTTHGDITVEATEQQIEDIFTYTSKYNDKEIECIEFVIRELSTMKFDSKGDYSEKLKAELKKHKGKYKSFPSKTIQNLTYRRLLKSGIIPRNISLEKYTIVQTEIQRLGLRSKAYLILGLPAETKETHFAAIYGLIDSGVQEFVSYQAMILKDTDLGSKHKRDSYGFKTKWRLIPMGLGLYEGANASSIVPECEEIIVATNTLSFEDYLDARRLHLIDFIYHNSGIFNLIYSYLEKRHINLSRFIEQIYLNSFQADFPLKDVMVGFTKETKGELFDSEESCVAFYSKPENLEYVKNSKIGGNLLFQYLSIALFEKWTYAVEVALIALQELAPDCKSELEDLTKILNIRIVDITQTPIKKSIPIKLSSQEIIELINEAGYNLKQDSSGDASFTMELSDSQYEVLSHAKTTYPENRAGRSLILKMHRVLNILRDIKADNSVLIPS